MKTFKFNPLFNTLFSIIRPVQFNMAAIGYVPGTAEETTFDDLPAGEYAVMIVNSEEKDYTDKNGAPGKFLMLEHQIMEGQYKNRKLFNNLFLYSPSSAKFAYGTLESICKAQSRLEAVSDSSELHNVPMIVKVTYNETRTDKEKNVIEIKEGSRNSISSYKKYTGEGTFQPVAAVSFQQPVATAAQPAAAEAATVGAAPWG